LSVNSPAHELTARDSLRGRVKIRDRVSVSVIRNDSVAGELTDLVPGQFSFTRNLS